MMEGECRSDLSPESSDVDGEPTADMGPCTVEGLANGLGVRGELAVFWNASKVAKSPDGGLAAYNLDFPWRFRRYDSPG